MTDEERYWVLATTLEAIDVGHIYPRMAACEAALESAYGHSSLAREAFNLFGLKAHGHPAHGTISLPTKEFLGGEWKAETDEWMKYQSIAECFQDRMSTLVRLRHLYPHYQAALTAADAATYIEQVSKTWSTDPARASKVLAIYNQAFSV